MPTTIAEAFAAAALKRQGIVRWGTTPPSSAPGVYVVSLTDSLDTFGGRLVDAPLARTVFERWLGVCPKLSLDNVRPTVQQLMDRIGLFWIPDEVIIYIGCASSLSKRLNGYYRTPIGERRPHSGGCFLQLLSNLDQLWVHYAPCPLPKDAEDGMLRRFCQNVSKGSRRSLYDPDHPFPFANLEWPHGKRKNHGLREARRRDSNIAATLASSGIALPRTLMTHPERPYKTQRVTAADLRGRRIRIPAIGTSSTKRLFPNEKREKLEVVLRGQLVRGSWDPRMGPDHERSGVLRVGVALQELVRENEVLIASARKDGITAID